MIRVVILTLLFHTYYILTNFISFCKTGMTIIISVIECFVRIQSINVICGVGAQKPNYYLPFLQMENRRLST